MHPESHACHAKRTSQRVISCVHATRPDANPHSTAPPTRPAACPRHMLRHARHARSPQPATRNARPPCVHKTRPKPNPHGTAPRHARGTPATCLKHARSPQLVTRVRQKCARRHTHTLAVHAAPQRERRSEPDSRTGPQFRKPRRCHPAALIEEFRKAREKDSGARS